MVGTTNSKGIIVTVLSYNTNDTSLLDEILTEFFAKTFAGTFGYLNDYEVWQLPNFITYKLMFIAGGADELMSDKLYEFIEQHLIEIQNNEHKFIFEMGLY